jgi:hypothetical protein
MRRREWSDSFSSVAAEAREQESELGLEAQKETRGQLWRIDVWLEGLIYVYVLHLECETVIIHA